MKKYQLTADDWVILRLLYLGVRGKDPAFRSSLEFAKVAIYIVNKLGKQAFNDAVDQLHEERKQKEVQAT